jgi:predicted outer membrane repeat protein
MTIGEATFANNTAAFGGGIALDGDVKQSWWEAHTLGGCTFVGNSAQKAGGGKAPSTKR